MNFDNVGGGGEVVRPWFKRGFIIPYVAGGILVTSIALAIIFVSFSHLTSGSEVIFFAGVGACFIALILGALILIYITTRNPNSKVLPTCQPACCGFYMSWYRGMTEIFSPPGATGTGGDSYSSDSTSRSTFQPPEVAEGFTYEELMRATNGFSPSNLLGEGGFGKVFRGNIGGKLVAVKRLNIGGGQGEREFRAEVDTISRVHHRHLVSLVGHCISDTQRLLVYKYAPNGSLYDALHGQGKPVLDWATRMNIALGTARGLAYLHEDCHPRIIHRDIKGSNILISAGWEGQVADFGLAKLAEHGVSHVSTRVMGTFGYVAPEYVMSGKLTDKSDVYSFGVVLLELISGRKHVYDVAGGEKVSLVEWARPLLTRAFDTENGLVDPKLRGRYDKKEMCRMMEVAANCVRQTAEKRPKMALVVRALDLQHVDLDEGIEHAGGEPSEHSIAVPGPLHRAESS